MFGTLRRVLCRHRDAQFISDHWHERTMTHFVLRDCPDCGHTFLSRERFG